MTRLRPSMLRLALSVALVTMAGSALAQSNGRSDERRGGPQTAREQQERPDHDHDRELSDAVRRAVREQRGRVLSAERVQYEGREVNRIKVIDDQGRVRVYVDDPHGNDGRRSDGRERRAETP